MIASANLKIKGHVHIIAEREGSIIYDHEQDNLWLDEGVRRLAWGYKNGYNSPYLCLSSNTTQPQYTDTSIPNIITTAQHAPTREDSYRRWKFQVGFYAPSAGTYRDIKTVGISYNSNGTSAYCYTVLTTPLLQDDKTTITVFYYVYVNSPSCDSNIGYGSDANWRYFSGLFYGGDNNNYTGMSVTFAKVGKIFPDNWVRPMIFNNAHSSKVAGIGSGDYDWTNFRYTKTCSIGSAGDLGSWTSSYIHGLFFLGGGPFIPFKFNTFGRVWGKQYLNISGGATNPVAWYDTNNPTYGYMKAIQARSKTTPYSPPSSVNASCYRFFPIVSGELTTTGEVGVARYFFSKEDRVETQFAYLDSDYQYNSYFYAEVLYNKFNNRDILIYSLGHSESYTNKRGLYIGDIKNGVPGGSGRFTDFIVYPIYDTISEYSNCFYGIDLTNNEQRNIYKFENTTSALNSLTKTLVGAANSTIYHAVMMDDKKILLYHEGKVTTFDTVTNQQEETWINSFNLFLEKFEIHNYPRSWGDYDSVTNRIYLLNDNVLLVMDKDGLVNYNTFNGIMDTGNPTNWGFINHTGNLIDFNSSGKLYISPSYINFDSIGVTRTHLDYTRLGQYMNDGPFEATVELSEFNPRGDSGLNFGLDITNLTLLKSEICSKRISIERSLIDFKVKSVSILNNTATTEATTEAINTVTPKGAKLSIPASGALYSSSNIGNADRIFNGNTGVSQDVWFSSPGNFIWKFNNATKVNRVEMIADDQGYKIRTLNIYGS
ncbi:MAG: hypothetical protein RBR68_15685, partial [Tenuifilaceae bacterium]|nr:hypothetical protein [Tenuifilaceae bacterium]